MAARIQNKVLGLGIGKQSNISTASSSYWRAKQLNMELAPNGFATENDAAEIGKGNEFASSAGLYPVSYNPAARLDKYASAEFMVWAWAYALSSVSFGTGTYTLTPLDPTVTLEPLYFSVVEQIPEGSGEALDNAFIGCAMEDVTYEFNYGPGRQSGKCTANWVGSGKITSPSGATIPATQPEYHLTSPGMTTLSVNGVDLIGTKTMVSGAIGWKNNFLPTGFFPSSGLQNGAAIRGRLEVGARVPTLNFTARLLSASTASSIYSALTSLATGSATLTVTFDSTHTVTFSFPAVSFETVMNEEKDGIVTATVNCIVKYDGTNPVLTVTGKCGISGIGQ